MSLLWLADVLRADGLVVVEHAGWKTHDRPGDWSPRYGVVHATAAPRSQSDDTQVRIVRDGRSDLPGPIANATVDRRGRWHVLGSGRCNSTLAGTAGPFEGLGNTYALSTEACNDNVSEPWPDVQYDAYVRGWAAWCRRLGWPASRLVGHKEHTPGRKSDPTFDMDRFRRDVAAAITRKGDDDMQLSDRVDLVTGQDVAYAKPSTTVEGVLASTNYYVLQTRNKVLAELAAAKVRDEALLRAVSGDNADQVLAAIAAQGEQTRAALDARAAEDAQRDAELAGAVVAAVVAKLPADVDGGMTREQLVASVEQGVREAFAGGLAPDDADAA